MEVIRILSLDHGLQYIAHVETVFGQVYMILVVDHLVLVGPSVEVYRWVQESTDPNQGQDSTSGSEYLFCRGGFCCVPVQDIDPVVEEWYFGLACVRRHSCGLGVKCTRRDAEVESKGRRLLDERSQATCTKSVRGANAR